MCSPIERRMRDSGSPGRLRRGALGARGLGLRPVRATRCAAAAPRRCAAVLDEREHVLLAHAPAAAGARHRVEVDAVLGGDALHDRRVAARPLPRGLRASRRGAGVAARRRVAGARPRRASTALPRRVVDPRQHRPDVDRLAHLARGSRPRVRAAGAGTSVSILSVEISQIVSSASTQSPACLRHSTTVPSATDTPICGIVTSTQRLSTRGAQGRPP